MGLNRLRLQAILSSQARKGDLPYLCEVEYLESTGEQYITIPYQILETDTFRHETVHQYTKISGSQYEGQTSAGNWYGINAGKYTIGGGVISTFTASTTDFDNIVAESNETGLTLTVNGNIVGTRNSKSSGTKVYLFDCYNPNASVTNTSYLNFVRKKYHKLYVNGSLFFDGIPVLDYNMKPAMYDRVTKKLFYNEGTGADFKYGRQIYYCDYIVGFGEEYIDAGFSPNSNTSFEAIFTKHSTTTKAIFGSRRLYQQDSYCFSFMNVGGIKIDYGSSAVTTDFRVVNQKIHLKKEKEKNYIDGNEYTANKVQTFSVVPTFLLFSVQNADGTTATKGDMALYMAKLWDNDVLVRDYKPAYDENGVAFMFDRVTHTIYDNAGTGAFKAGFEDKQGNLYTKVSYLESTGEQWINTEIIPANYNSNYQYEITYQYINSASPKGQSVLGCVEDEKRVGTLYHHGSTSNMYLGNGKQVEFTHDTGFNKTHLDVNNDEFTLYNNDKLIAKTTFIGSTLVSIPLFLFAANSFSSGGAIEKARVRIKSFWFRNGNRKQVFAGIPVINSDGKPAMFDMVTKKPFYNDGTGTDFIVGE